MNGKGLSKEINRVLDGYIFVHDEIFRFSLRQIIPIPGIFKPINYESHHKKLGFLQDRLSQIIKDIPENSEFSKLLKEYAQSLLNTILWLQDICQQFTDRINGIKDYTKNEYDKDMETYTHSVNTYRNLGVRLNKLYKELDNNVPFSES